MKSANKKLTKCYQPLYDHIYNNYDVLLTVSEMDDILRIAEKVTAKIVKYYMVKCDVVNCKLEASTQGMYCRNTGYVCLCAKHSAIAQKNERKLNLRKNIKHRTVN